MYKDKDKQREAQREWVRQKRAAKGSTGNKIQDATAKLVQDKQGLIDKSTVQVLEHQPKRGKDIKCFADLPPDVQQTIDIMSEVDGKIDQTIKANRTAIAINYQHLFPDRYYSTGNPTMANARRVGLHDGCER